MKMKPKELTVKTRTALNVTNNGRSKEIRFPNIFLPYENGAEAQWLR